MFGNKLPELAIVFLYRDVGRIYLGETELKSGIAGRKI